MTVNKITSLPTWGLLVLEGKYINYPPSSQCFGTDIVSQSLEVSKIREKYLWWPKFLEVFLIFSPYNIVDDPKCFLIFPLIFGTSSDCDYIYL